MSNETNGAHNLYRLHPLKYFKIKFYFQVISTWPSRGQLTFQKVSLVYR